jgi:hypothetical protein
VIKKEKNSKASIKMLEGDSFSKVEEKKLKKLTKKRKSYKDQKKMKIINSSVYDINVYFVSAFLVF